MNNEEKENIINFSFELKEKLNNCSLEDVKKQSSPPERYTEAMLIKKLQADEIGRPSTFATIVETVLSESRGYAKLEDKKIVPTERGLQLAAYLDRAFPNLINLTYTKDMEESLDKIATGSLTKIDFLTDFFNNLETSIKNNKEKFPIKESVNNCPECGSPLVVRRSRFGKLFKGCSNYPNCRHIENMD